MLEGHQDAYSTSLVRHQTQIIDDRHATDLVTSNAGM